MQIIAIAFIWILLIVMGFILFNGKERKLRKQQEDARWKYIILCCKADIIRRNPDFCTQQEIQDLQEQMRECENCFSKIQ